MYFEDVAPKLSKKAEVYEKGRKGLLFAIAKLGLAMFDVSNAVNKQQVTEYNRLIPTGAGVVSPDEAMRMLYEKRAEYSLDMAEYCSKKAL